MSSGLRVRASLVQFAVGALWTMTGCAPAHLDRGSALPERGIVDSAIEVCKTGEENIKYFSNLNVLCINGEIDIDGKMLRQIQSIKSMRDGVTVVAKSPGGGMVKAIAIAKHLENYKYNIVVNDICASACAQFLFMAAKFKFIANTGFVGIHGGPIPKDKIEKMDISENEKKALLKEQDVFRRFYFDRKIDLEICTDAPPSVLSKINSGQLTFWMPTEVQFQKYNVHNVVNMDSKYLKLR